MDSHTPTSQGETAFAGRPLGPDATVAAFPLGGIGTGNVSIGQRGQLRDWEVFNGPGKGNALPYTFFAIRAETADGRAVAKVLEARLRPPFEASHGFYSGDLAGLPRLDSSVMRGEYPLVRVDFEDEELPVGVSLEAFTPLVPLDADASGIPAAVLRYSVRNSGPLEARVTVAGSLANAVGFDGYELFFYPQLVGTPRNEYRDDGGMRGVLFASDLPEDHLKHGTVALLTRDGSVSAKEEWLDGYWWDGAHDFWDDFCDDGRLELRSRNDADGGPLSFGSKLRVGSLAVEHTLAPGEARDFEFVLAWHFPNRPRGWGGHIIRQDPHLGEIVRNRYARHFRDAWHAGAHLLENLDRLEGQTRAFHKALYGSTLPAAVVDAVSATIPVLRSTTCFRLEDGTFLAWEGTFDRQGSCEGNCTHVWNYAQTLAYLFPELERSMRRVEFLLETDDEGNMAFRTNRVFGGPRWDMLPAADGQLGAVVRLYREWKLSGDDAFLRELWPRAAKAIEFAFAYWDTDGDGVLDSRQHNTYDIEFHGPNSLTNSVFFAALKAGAEMADRVGDRERADRFRHTFERGSATMDRLLWGGEYYVQVIEDVDAHRYQYGRGCLADQVFGQLLAHVAGLGYVLPRDHVRQAIAAVYRHNFRETLRGHHSVQRTYALNDEAGLLLCTWPYGGRPRLPFVYCDEVWTGVEYQVAAHLIFEGFTAEGLRLVEAVRDRYDGRNRNPWNEVECGNHYARSMAGWALLLALSGFRYDATARSIGFDPRVNAEDFRCPFSAGRAWGTFHQRVAPDAVLIELRIEGGELGLERLALGEVASSLAGASLSGRPLATRLETTGSTVVFVEPLALRAGEALELRLLRGAQGGRR